MENNSGVNNNGGEVFLNGGVENEKAVQVLQQSFDKVKGILQRNRILIQEIEKNQEAGEADGLRRNVPLILELNNNTAHVQNLYSELSTAFSCGLAKGSPIDSAATANRRAHRRARVGEYYSDFSLAKDSPTDADAAKEG